MQTASQIIDLFGGPAALAKESGIPLTTIIGWRDANFIPEWRRPTLIALAADCDTSFALAESDFPARDARISRAQRDAAA